MPQTLIGPRRWRRPSGFRGSGGFGGGLACGGRFGGGVRVSWSGNVAEPGGPGQRQMHGGGIPLRRGGGERFIFALGPGRGALGFIPVFQACGEEDQPAWVWG
ncbi:MAG: hypothetical protein M2R45_01137 [Verrucomicrobia subdivision 3 bacterium]|nr:hypothetical protein [Limisphaerales bacterium]MCS1417883.1 hypothetical protein [Limisphaerales bacterium]